MITQEYLKSILHYDPETGIFTRNIARGNRTSGTPAGTKQSTGHLRLWIGRRGYLLHRLAWLYMTGSFPEGQIDHINVIPDDNRWCNLREATNGQNQANSPADKTNTSGFKGASKIGNRWRATISNNGKFFHIGCFATPEEAHQAYCKAADRLHGEFSRHH